MYLIFQQTFVYILYLYKMYTKCISHFNKLLYTFCIQNLADIVLFILYTKCIQKLVKMWYAFCIHFVYILYTSVVYILYNFHIQIVYTVSAWVLQGPILSFALSNLHMNSLSNDIVSTIKQFVDDVLLSFITLNAKSWAYKLNSNLKNKSEWLFINSDLNKQAQAQAQEVKISRTTKLYHSQTVSTIY